MTNEPDPSNAAGDGTDLAPVYLSNIYVGHIDLESGKIQIQTDASDTPFSASAWGEIIFYGHIAEDNLTLVIERLLRLAVRGYSDKPDDDPRIRFYSLTGPLEPVKVDDAPVGKTEPFPLDLYYSELSRHEKGKYEHPQVETLWASLIWETLTEESKPGNPVFSITLETREITNQVLGVVKSISFQFPHLIFGGTPPPAPQTQMRLINTPLGVAACTPPTAPGSPLNETLVQTLKLRFINFSTQVANIQAVIQQQMQSACDIWCRQGALELVPEPNLIEDTASVFRIFTDDDMALGVSPVDNVNLSATDALEVCFVDNLNLATFPFNDTGGAACINMPGNPYIVIRIQPNGSPSSTTLLAHELSHLLRLRHPDTLANPTFADYESSVGSVTQPSSPAQIYNTLYNCRAFYSPSPALNGLVRTKQVTVGGVLQNVTGWFHPDGDFFIRDYPNDVGAEPDPIPAGVSPFDQCSVWNRQSNTSGLTASGSIVHENPWNTDPTNYIYVQFKFLHGIWNPVNIDLYFTKPGATPGTWELEPVAPVNRIVYTTPSTPAPPYPVEEVVYLPWHPDQMPAHWSKHACLLAVATFPGYVPRQPITLNLLSTNILTSNKIVQRNMDFVLGMKMGKRSFRMSTPFLYIQRPEKETAQAGLLIDTSKAGRLGGVRIEFDNGETYEVNPGGQEPIPFYDLLEPGETRMLRIAALIPGDAKLNETFPLNVVYVEEGKNVSGYQYILKIASPKRVIEDTVDSLYGALKAVAEGYHLEQAIDAARKARSIVRRRDNWKSKLQSMARLKDEVESLAGCLDPYYQDDYKTIAAELSKIAELLGMVETDETADTIMHLRDRIDLVQEHASRLARMPL